MHLITGLYDCQRSRVPVFAIAAQIPSREIGSGYFQEIHPEHSFGQCSHYCELVSQPERVPRALEIGIQTAISRRGVCVIALPGDIASKDAVVEGPAYTFTNRNPTFVLLRKNSTSLADLLNRSKKITIFGGAGCAGVHAELMELAGKLQAPVVHALRGKEFIEYDNLFDIGMTGLLGFSSGYFAMMICEVLLMIGTDFPYQEFSPKDATIVQIDLRGEQLGRRTKLDFGFVGDTKTTLRALLPKLELNQHQLLVDLRNLRRVPTESRCTSPAPGTESSLLRPFFLLFGKTRIVAGKLHICGCASGLCSSAILAGDSRCGLRKDGD